MAVSYKRKTCDGCQYDVEDIILNTNCVGCLGRGSRPHYVPYSPDASIHWWENINEEDKD